MGAGDPTILKNGVAVLVERPVEVLEPVRFRSRAERALWVTVFTANMEVRLPPGQREAVADEAVRALQARSRTRRARWECEGQREAEVREHGE